MLRSDLRSHNPEVARSNPAPAIGKQILPPLSESPGNGTFPFSVRRGLHHQRMDRVLLNPWVSRAGNLSFLIGVVVLVYRLLRGQDPFWVITIALLAIGIVLIAAPRIETGDFRPQHNGGAMAGRRWDKSRSPN